MIVPIYKNLPSSEQAYKQFRVMRDAGQLKWIRSGGRIIYMQRGKFTPLFIGVKSVRVKRQFNFEGSWVRRVPAAVKRGQQKVDRVVASVERSAKWE